jgi:MSHA biogenesis protein MshO
MKRRTTKPEGFTLIELVIVIVLSGILATVVMRFITAPVEAYVDQDRRARLVDIAHHAMGQLSRETQRALPNSLRIGCGGACVEFLRVVAGGRYRVAPPSHDVLSFVPADNDASFDVLGPLDGIAGLSTSGAANGCVQGQAACVVIYNTGQAGTDAWNRDHAGGAWRPDNMATLVSVSAGSITFDNSHFSSGDTAFPAASPGQRFYLVDSPVSFVCDGGQLRRYEGYSITHRSEAPTRVQLLGLSNPPEEVLVADQIAAGGCVFDYDPGSLDRNGLLTVALTIEERDAPSGTVEQVRLLKQIHVANLP